MNFDETRSEIYDLWIILFCLFPVLQHATFI